MNYPFYEAQLRQQYRLLKHAGYWTQGRCINVTENKIISQKLLKGEEEVVAWAAENNGKGNIFLGRNPRQQDGTVADFRCLSIDIDPIRAKGNAATDNQHQCALEAAKRVGEHFGYGVIGSSGNGSLLLFPLREPVNKDVGERLGKALETEARRIIRESDGLQIGASVDLQRSRGLGDVVTVDSTWDSARLVKCMGAISTKGDPALWRHARLLYGTDKTSPPEGFVEGLEQVVSTLSTGSSNQQSLDGVEKGTLDRSKADIALANRLKLQGFGPEDALRSLMAYSMRPEREDDHRRIIQKVFFGQGQIKDLVNEKAQIKLWTPQNGADGYNERRAGRRAGSDLTTGIPALDRLTRGIQRTSILTVGARTDCGKTAFAIGAAFHNCHRGKRVLYFSTENEYEEIWDRYFATATGISAYRLQDGRVDGHDRQVIDSFNADFKAKHQFAVYDGSRPTVLHVRRTVEDFAPDLVIFDYFQHFEQKDARLLAEFVIQIHELVREKKIGALFTAMAHDRWDLKTRKPLPISMGDIKDCHTIQDESRTVVLLDWDRDSVVGDGAAAVKCVLAKNKGPRDTLVLKLNRTIPRFEEDINDRNESNKVLQMPEAVPR